jgi:hypothetical protein
MVLYTRHGLHLNAKRKKQTANRVASAIKDLFRIRKALLLALKRKDNEDSYQSVTKQMLGGMSGHKNKILLQMCGNSDYIKSDEINKLSANNQVQAVQELQESICVNKVYKKI